MGGEVAVTVRLSEHEQYRMTWGTAGLDLIRDSAFLNQEGNFWSERLEQWRNNSDLAGMLAPGEYGLVVVDFVTRRILSYQSYTALSELALVNVNLWPRNRATALSMLESGRITGVRMSAYYEARNALFRRKRPVPIDTVKPIGAFGANGAAQLAAILDDYQAWNWGEGKEWSVGDAVPMVPDALVLNFADFKVDEGAGGRDELATLLTVLKSDLGLSINGSEQEVWNRAVARPLTSISGDLLQMREAAFWMVRSGHTMAQEAETFAKARMRLANDFKYDEEIQKIVREGDNDAFMSKISLLIQEYERQPINADVNSGDTVNFT